MISRRHFISLLGGATMVWPSLARAQQPAIPVIGFLNSLSPSAGAHRLAAFRTGLREAGYDEGHNVRLEFRWAEGRYDRLPIMARELVEQSVVVIVAGATVATMAAKAATSSIPIVFAGVGGDPVKLGLVASFNRPGGNITGFAILIASLGLKRLEILSELVARATKIGVLINPDNPNSKLTVSEMPAAATTLGRTLLVATTRSDAELEAAFGTLAEQQAGALIVDADPLFLRDRERLVALAARYALPAIYQTRDFPEVGGLMSYGPSIDEAFRLAGGYAARIIKGEKPADLPVQAPTKYELVVNLKTAKALGLTVPAILLARADEVIE